VSSPKLEAKRISATSVESGPVQLVLQLARELRTLLELRFSEFDLTLAQAAVLVRSCQERHARPNQLARELGMDAAGITRLVDRLEAKGLLTRTLDPGNRRSFLIDPTSEGRAVAPRIGPVFGRATKDLLYGFNHADTAALTELLGSALANVKAAKSRG
jgi:DNA-binding MarR family transcriptional regulator